MTKRISRNSGKRVVPAYTRCNDFFSRKKRANEEINEPWWYDEK